ncbi:MAG: class I SAM-dependent RNA methyltransferase [Nitriliruptoraceae bacterium]
MSNTHRIVIDGIAHGGDGVGRLDGKAVFIPGALPGETVTVELTQQRPRYARGRLTAVITPAPERVAAPCPHVARCGGCDFQHVSLDGQAALKHRIVTEQLTRLGGLNEPTITPTVKVNNTASYRSQTRMHVTDTGVLGFYAKHTHTVVPIDQCLVFDPAVQQARDEIDVAAGAASVSIRSFTAGSASVTVEPSATNQTALADTVKRLSQLDTITLADTPDATTLDVAVGKHTFRVPAGAFFQASPAAAKAITDAVLERTGDITNARVADLYAGIGLFAVPLAHRGAHVTAVESHRVAARAARANTRDTPTPVTVVTDTVEQFVARHADTFDVVVLDPPRSGAGADVLAGIVGLKPKRIVYVACDVAALARDTRTLSNLGYTFVDATPIDAFTMTHHVEVVAGFIRCE